MNGAFKIVDSELHVENVPLSCIAEDVGTPTYIYSAAAMKSQYDSLAGALKRAMPDRPAPLLCYAAKANSNLAVLAYLKSLGSGLEIVSEGELIRALKAGIDPQKIVATGVGKTDSEIAAEIRTGILQINVESIEELENVNRIAGETGKIMEVVFRWNPNVKGGGHEKITTGRTRDKFGIGADRIEEAFGLAEKMDHVHACGLSMHIGSQVFTVESFKKAFETLPALVRKLRENRYTIERLDIGGGFPIVYKDEKLLDLDAYAQWVADIIAPLDVQIILEPGRYLVGNAGILLSKVLYVKKTDERDFLVLDAGMNDLIRPAMYDAYHEIEAVRSTNRPWQTYDVVGPVCETGDTFTRGRELPTLEQGELVALKSAGAYGASMGSNYNTRLLPAEVLVHGDKYDIIRKRQTYDDLLANENIPDWL